MRTIALACVLLACIALFPSSPAVAQDAAAAGRDILKAHQDAVVTVRLVISQQISIGGRTQNEDTTEEATGTIIHPSGLTVLSLSETDPSSFFESMMGGANGPLGGMQFESSVTDVQIMLRNGDELEGEFVLRDKDLDLAYVRPKEAAKEPLAFVDLGQSVPAQVLEQLVALNRLGKVANRVSAAAFELVQAVVEKPRTFYVLGSQATQSSLGSPVFNLEGQPVGIVLLRAIRSTESGGGGLMSMMMGGRQDSMIPILLPGKDIAQHIDQALAQQPDTDSDEAAPQEKPVAAEDSAQQ